MINTVTKNYNMDNVFCSYKVTYVNGQVWDVPHDEANTDYQNILQWVAEGNTITAAD